MTSPVYTAIAHLPRTGLPTTVQNALSGALTGLTWTQTEKHDLARDVLTLSGEVAPDPCPVRCPCWYGGACEHTDAPDYLPGGVL